MSKRKYFDVVMTRLPSAKGEFVELEDENERGVGKPRAEWIARPHGLWALRIYLPEVEENEPDKALKELVAAENRGWQRAHDPRSCGHPRACYLDENWPESEKNYDPVTRTSDPPSKYRCIMCVAEARIEELERRAKLSKGSLSCGGCGGPHAFDTSIPSAVWNRVIRAKGLSEYLCMSCIVREFVKVGRSFTAELSGSGFSGVPIEIRVRGEVAQDASVVSDENNRLRVDAFDRRKEVGRLQAEVKHLTETHSDGCEEALLEVQAERDKAEAKITRLRAALENLQQWVNPMAHMGAPLRRQQARRADRFITEALHEEKA